MSKVTGSVVITVTGTPPDWAGSAPKKEEKEQEILCSECKGDTFKVTYKDYEGWGYCCNCGYRQMLYG